MIAATDPQEFVPGGRQQALRHPGPIESLHVPDCTLSDNFLLQRFEQVSLSDVKDSEWWILRESPSKEQCNSTDKSDDYVNINVPNNFEDSWTSNKSGVSKIKQFSRTNLSMLKTKNRTSDFEMHKNESTTSKVVAQNVTHDDKFKCKLNVGFMEEELYVRGNIVVWSKGLVYDTDEDNSRATICCYSSLYLIKHALWCDFYCEMPLLDENTCDVPNKVDEPAGKVLHCVCIVDAQNMKVFTHDNEDFISTLPFQVKKIWNTKFGVFLEKEFDGKNKEIINAMKTPTVFSLSHPLDEIYPIGIVHGTLQLFEDQTLQIVYTNVDPSICMIYDQNSGLHSVYKIRKVKNDEGLNVTEKTTQSGFSRMSKMKSDLFFSEVSRNTPATQLFVSPFNSRANSVMSTGSHLSSRSHNTSNFSRCHSPVTRGVLNNGSPWLLKHKKLQSSLRLDSNPNIIADNLQFETTQHIHNYEPDVCVDLIWNESSAQNQETLSSGAASKVFLSDDLTGQWYLCYLKPLISQLFLVKVDFTNTNCIIFGNLSSISAKDAVSIPHLHMMAILQYCGNVVLYSGQTVVGKLHIGGVLAQHVPSPYVMRQNLQQFNSPFPRRSSMLSHCGTPAADPRFDEHLLSPVLPAGPSSRTCNLVHLPNYCNEDSSKSYLIGLRDTVRNRVTLEYTDGTYYRIALPTLASSSLVESCLKSFRQTLPKDIALTLLTRWYSVRNAPGPSDITLEKEWDLFTNLLFELLGYFKEHSQEVRSDQAKTPLISAKRQRSNSKGTDSDWNRLIKTTTSETVSEILSQTLNLEKKTSDIQTNEYCNEYHVDAKAILFPHIKLIHYSFHLLYEDLKLNTLRKEELPLLAQFLYKLSIDLNLKQYELYYFNDFTHVCALQHGHKRTLIANDHKNISWQNCPEKPPSVVCFLIDLLEKREVNPFPIIKHINCKTKEIILLCGMYITFTSSNNKINVNHLIQSESFLGVRLNMSSTSKEKYIDFKEPIVHKIVSMMAEMGFTNRHLDCLPIGINLLLHNALWFSRECPPLDWPTETYNLLHRSDLAAQAEAIDKNKDNAVSKYEHSNVTLQETISIKHNESDQVDGMEGVNNVLWLLRFPDDLRVAEARKLLQSSKPVPIVLVQRPDVSDHDFIEEQEKHLYAICTRTMALPVGRGMFTLRITTPVITEPLPIPSLCLTGKAPPRGTTVELTRIDAPSNMNFWPLFHNGVANGLRISPEAHNIDSTWITFNRPKNSCETSMEHAGFLMALGLNGHLKNLAILNTFDYLAKRHEMTSLGVLLGLSAAFQGTANLTVTKLLSVHVEALLPPTSMELDIPQNLQIAALMGIGLLYRGTAHRHMTEILLSEIGRPPGPEMENSVDRESYSLAAGLALGLVTLRHGGRTSGMADLNVPDTLHYYMVGGNKRPLTGSQKDKYKVQSFQIKEGTSVNLDVTAPGATLALGLMYLGTGNKAIADWMAPPDTQYLLDFVRPDFLMLRTLSRALIMWNDIRPDKEWIEKQVPNSIRPFCMVQPIHSLDIDYEAMNQAYCNIIAGACFAVGLKYAGSANEEAFQSLLQFCQMFTSLTSKSIAELAGKPTIETCLNFVLLAVSMVMAGTANLEIMRIVRHLRRRVGVASSAVVTYGSHLAIHMALGLLFLGGGRYTLSNSPASIAALICAFYPKFPTHSNDNRYHLQAFRHLYVLAVEPRLVIPKDVSLQFMCYAKIKVITLNGETITFKGPGLLPDLDTLYKVAVDDERYWPVLFEKERNFDQLAKILKTNGYIEVQQRVGCLNYIQDKFGYISDLAHTISQSSSMPWDPPADAITTFTSDCTIKHFCDYYNTILKESNSLEEELRQMLTRVTYECVVKDKLFVLPIFASLLKIIQDLQHSPDNLQLQQFKLITSQVLKNHVSSTLISTELILTLKQRVVSILDGWEVELKPVLKDYILGRSYVWNSDTLSKLSVYVTFYDIDFNCNVNETNPLLTLMNLQSSHSSECIEKILNALY